MRSKRSVDVDPEGQFYTEEELTHQPYLIPSKSQPEGDKVLNGPREI